MISQVKNLNLSSCGDKLAYQLINFLYIIMLFFKSNNDNVYSFLILNLNKGHVTISFPNEPKCGEIRRERGK